MTIWQFQTKLSSRLLTWSVASIVGGVLLLRGNAFWKGVGWQFIGWGTIDAGIALFGQASANTRLNEYENPGAPQVLTAEAENLQRLLWFNAFLDVLYILGGKRWADGERGNGQRSGTGLGIAIQGAFLLIFDIYHALQTPKENVR